MPHDELNAHRAEHSSHGSVWEVFLAFLQLGLTSFGGPIAHLGYFRTEFVERRRWLDDPRYSELVTLCQFLPGPASSQVGMALGLGRAGWLGALAAWVGFTAPSAIALTLFALSVLQWPRIGASGAVHGLKVAAVAIVAQAVVAMARSLCPDYPRRLLAAAAALVVLLSSAAATQVVVLVVAGVIGVLVVRPPLPAARQASGSPVTLRVGALLLAVFAILLFALPIVAAATGTMVWAAVAAFYRAGSMVFGGGHVVLPLLQTAVVSPGWISNEVFLAGYGAAQAVPGPLFTFAAYLGAAMPSPLGGWLGSTILLLALFLPAFLLVAGALPFWTSLQRAARLQRAFAGVNAAVVGVLAAALYDPIWVSAVHSVADFLVAAAAFVLLVYCRMSPILVVVATALACSVITA